MTCWLRIPSRSFGVSIHPPVPIAEPVVNDSSPLSTALSAAVSSDPSGTFSRRSRAGSAATSISFFVSPHIATLATPGTWSNRARMLKNAIFDRSRLLTVFEVMPTCMTRLVADTIGYRAGGAAHDGSDGDAAASRSCTSCRAWRTSVPCLKYRKIADSCGTDSDSTSVTRGTP